MVGWCATNDLTSARLLEPAAGGGEFVVQAAERLAQSFRRKGVEPRARDLKTRIVAFELYARASCQARRRVVRKLVSMRVHRGTAKSCAKAWIRTGDFLLSEKASDEYTHVVGNPPYVRWSKVPGRLRKVYDELLSSEMARGDLYLPFLDRALDELKAGGKLGFVCADRWQYAVYGDGFRRKWLSRLKLLSNRRVEAAEAFTRNVSAYANVLVALKLEESKGNAFCSQNAVLPWGRSLTDRGCVIRVGPALGVSSAFVFDDETVEIEPNILVVPPIYSICGRNLGILHHPRTPFPTGIRSSKPSSPPSANSSSVARRHTQNLLPSASREPS